MDGSIAGAARASVTTAFGPDGAAEQDAEAVWRETLDAAARALGAAGVSSRDVAAVVVSAQYSSIVPVDANMVPVAPMVTWMDQRSSPKRLRRLSGRHRLGDPPLVLARYLAVHGLAPIEAGMSINHMRWIRAARPDLYERTAFFLEPVDYLTARLSGRATANQCSAFMQMLADNRKVPSVGWHPDLVAASGIDGEKLPECVAAGSVVGTVTREVTDRLGLPPTTQVLSGINDTQAGAVAAGVGHGDHGGLAVGTTAVIVAGARRKKVDPFRSMFTMPSPLGTGHLLSAENGVAGVAVDHFLDGIVDPDDLFATTMNAPDRYRAFDDAAAAAPAGSSGVLFLPWLRGSIAPKADGSARGGFLGVGLDTTRHDLARAVLEGVALNLRWLQDASEGFLGRDLPFHRFYGGGATSVLWGGILADVLDRRVERLDRAGYANSLGTAFFAFDRLGVTAAGDLADALPIASVHEPDPGKRGLYEDLAGTFRLAFKRTRPVSHRLVGRR